MNKIFSLIILGVLSLCQAHATTYYLSSGGKDSNNGTFINNPWKTIQRLNQQILKPGDKVLFKRGEVFFGEILIKQSGSVAQPIIFSAYGKGSLPIITGAVKINNFIPYNSNIWKVKFNHSVKSVFVNERLKTLARFPNSGFAIMQSGVGDSVTFIDSALKQKEKYWENTNLRFRTWDWEVRTSVVKKFENYKVTISDSSTNTLGKGWGYYFDNKFEELDTLGEWFYSIPQKTLYYYGGKNFKNKSAEAVTLNNGITFSKKVSYITVRFLNIQKFDVNGVSLSENNSHIVLSNNKISFINHTGILINEIAKNCSVVSNEISEINGRGIFALEPENLKVQYNHVHKIGLKMGYGISGVNGMIGITIANNEVAKLAQSHIAINNNIKNNTVENTGYVGIRMDGAFSVMENNIVNNALLKLSDGAAIYCWAKTKFYTHDNKIINNIVSNVIGSNYGTNNSHKAPDANGIYLDNLVYNIFVEANTVSNISANGIHINSDSYDNEVKNNMVYNCRNALSVAEWAKPNSTLNNTFWHNTVFINQKSFKGVFLINWLVPSTKNMASFDFNKYYALQSDTVARDLYNSTDSAGIKITIDKNYTLKDWNETFGYEKNGFFTHLKPINSKAKLYPRLVVNTEKNSKIYSFKNQAVYNLNQQKISVLKLASYQSAVILVEK